VRGVPTTFWGKLKRKLERLLRAGYKIVRVDLPKGN